jgi:uncharacterized RDD family membrane protein YckC
MATSEPLSAVPVSARPYQGHPAGIVSRGAAAVVDLLLGAGIVAGLYLGVAGVAFIVSPRRFHWPSNLGWSLPVVGFVVAVAYLTLTWCVTGRSYGDALFGLRVINVHGDRVNVVVAVVRAALYVFFPIGLLWVVVSGKNRSVQDIVLRTSVIYDWVPEQPRAVAAAHH